MFRHRAFALTSVLVATIYGYCRIGRPLVPSKNPVAHGYGVIVRDGGRTIPKSGLKILLIAQTLKRSTRFLYNNLTG
jgi:hypothetical protein